MIFKKLRLPRKYTKKALKNLLVDVLLIVGGIVGSMLFVWELLEYF